MPSRNEKKPVVISETGPPTAEHRKASRDGTIALVCALVFVVLGGAAALAGFNALALTSAGIVGALLVVGLMLHYEGERQRQRPDPSRADDRVKPGIKSRTFRS